MIPRITNNGLAAQIREMAGDGITFTCIKIGNGSLPADYKTLTDLENPIVRIEITEFDAEDSEGYVKIVGIFNNNNIDSSFRWMEVGIFIQDPDNVNNELLYAYGHVDLEDNDETAAVIPASGSEVYEVRLTYRIYIGEAEDVNAIVAESSTYATKTELNTHINNRSNPHGTTKTHVGLGNVPNVATDDQTPTIQTASNLTALAAGDTLKTIVGKVSKAINDLITHLGNTVIHVTASERTKWNKKADASHTHSASDITKGVLSIARGGTGCTEAVMNEDRDTIVTRASYFECEYAKIATWGKLAVLNISFRYIGTSTYDEEYKTYILGTLKEEYRPAYTTEARYGNTLAISIASDGVCSCYVTGGLRYHTSIVGRATYILAN